MTVTIHFQDDKTLILYNARVKDIHSLDNTLIVFIYRMVQGKLRQEWYGGSPLHMGKVTQVVQR
jgi:hypothetical protein